MINSSASNIMILFIDKRIKLTGIDTPVVSYINLEFGGIKMGKKIREMF